MITFSIIIPAYNSQDYLRECIDSALAQSIPFKGRFGHEIEIILVDDGSTDNTGAICDEYAVAHECIRVIHQKNQGVSVARNVGLAASHGSYIAFCDADDILMPNFLKIMYVQIRQLNLSIVACKFIEGKSIPQGSHSEGTDMELADTYTPEKAVEQMLYQNKINTSFSGKLFERKCLGDAPFTPGLRFEDLDAMHRVMMNCDKGIGVINMCLYFYRDNPNGYINSRNADRFDVLKVTESIVEAYKDRPELAKAAHDRDYSANYNSLLLAKKLNDKELARKCRKKIRHYAFEVLLNPKSRLKNKLGALAAWFI